MEEAELDRSEEATPFKLKRARERGAVARGMDLGFFAALAAAIGFLSISGMGLAASVARSSAETLAAAGSLGHDVGALGTVALRLVAPLMMTIVTFAGALFGIALVLDFFQVGPVFSVMPLKPDFSKINPAKGFKRLFSWRLVIESLKATFKLLVYGFIGWLVLSRLLRGQGGAFSDGQRLGMMLLSDTLRLLSLFALAALVFALIDQLYVRRDFAKRMRMSRRDLKREYRDREGEPRLKQKRKQLHIQFSNAVRALRDVRGSDIVITNPTHFAVALRYDGRTMDAPRITARGAGEMATRIKRIAFTYGVLTIGDPTLARALYRRGKLGGEIPADTFEAVAGIYRRHNLAPREAS